jgi:transposase
VTASLEPGASVSTIAREAGIHPSQLYGWRRQLCTAGDRFRAGADRSGGFARRSGRPGAIEIEFASGARMRITGAVDPAMLRAAVAALAVATSTCPEGKAASSSRFSGTTASACRSTPSGWNAAGSFGHRRLTAQW